MKTKENQNLNHPLRKIVFVINPISGINRKPKKIIQWINTLWAKQNCDFEIVKTAYAGHGAEIAKNAVKSGATMVVAIGGDGTINEVARSLIHTDVALGIVPAGSGNGFARSLKIPRNQQKAILALCQPQYRVIDAGKINKYLFFNIAGAGIDAQVSQRFASTKFRGPLPYAVYGLQAFLQYQPEELRIQIDGQEIVRSPLLISFANLPEFGTNAIIAPDALPDDGLLDLCVLNPLTVGKALRHLPKLFNGKITDAPEMEVFKAEKIVVQRSQNEIIHTDGDSHKTDKKLIIEVIPKALTVALPKEKGQNEV